MKFDDEIEIELDQDSISEEQLDQFCRELKQILATDEDFGQLLLKSMTDSPLSDTDVKNEDAQMALLMAAENPSGVLH